MRTACVVASASFFALVLPASARAQSRVSIEVGGAVSAYDLGGSSGPALSRGAIRVPDSAATGVGGNGVASSSRHTADGIAVAEVRPTIALDSGFLLAVGFRAGQAGLGDSGRSLVGGDLSIGFAHRWGRLLPFIKGLFGFNSYDVPGSPSHQTDLRADAVLGSRLYLTQRFYLAAAAFAGYGDQYGGSLSVGADVVQIFRRGVLP